MSGDLWGIAYYMEFRRPTLGAELSRQGFRMQIFRQIWEPSEFRPILQLQLKSRWQPRGCQRDSFTNQQKTVVVLDKPMTTRVAKETSTGNQQENSRTWLRRFRSRVDTDNVGVVAPDGS